MDFDFIYKLKTGKFWWLDVLLYFVLAFLVSLVLSYFILVLKVNSQEKNILKLEEEIASVGTEKQLEVERFVFEYKGKIEKFSQLIKEHKIPSNMLAFIEYYTIPDVWFHKAKIDSHRSVLELEGHSKDMVFLSKQMDIFEKDRNVKKISLLRSEISPRGGVEFRLGLSFDPKLITY